MGFREKLEKMELRVREGVGENGRKKKAFGLLTCVVKFT